MIKGYNNGLAKGLSITPRAGKYWQRNLQNQTWEFRSCKRKDEQLSTLASNIGQMPNSIIHLICLPLNNTMAGLQI